MTDCVSIDYLIRRHSQGMYKKVTYIRMHKFKIQKIKYLFITIKVQLITISSVVPYISETNSTSNSLRKKKTSREEKGGGKEKKEEKGNVKEVEKRRRKKEKGRKRVY